MFKKAVYSEVYNQLSDLKIERREIYRLMLLAVQRAEETDENKQCVAIWNTNAIESESGKLYDMVFKCAVEGGKIVWYIDDRYGGK